MEREVKISGGLYACLLVIHLQSSGVILMPAAAIDAANQDAWLSVLLGSAYALVLGWFCVWLALRHPGKSPVQIAQATMGKWGGGLVGLLYVGYLVWVFAVSLRTVLDFAVIVLLPGTPGRAIAALMGLVVLLGVWHGLEPIARVGFQTLVAIVGANLFIPLLLIGQFNILNRSPPLATGLWPIFRGALVTLPWFGEVILVLTLVPHLSRPKAAYRWTAIGVGGGALILITLIGLTTLILGPELPSRFLIPVYVLVQEITWAHIVERIELILVTVWLSGMFVKTSLLLFAAAEGTRQIIGDRWQKWAAVLITIVGVGLTQVWTSALETIIMIRSQRFLLITLGVQLAIPLALGIATVIRLLQRRSASHHA